MEDYLQVLAVAVEVNAYCLPVTCLFTLLFITLPQWVNHHQSLSLTVLALALIIACEHPTAVLGSTLL